jgi:predicted anti-sigma-YlaC factor YlaD
MDRYCRETRERLPEFADGAIGEVDRLRLTAHLEACATCRQELRRWEALNHLLDAGLRTEEPVTPDGVEEAIARVHQARPVWRVAPAPLRFWRTWTPAATLALAAAILAAVGWRTPWNDLGLSRELLRQPAQAFAAGPADLADLAHEVTALGGTVRSLPAAAETEFREQWDEGTSRAQALVSWAGPVPIAVAVLMLLVMNVAFARGALAPRQPSHERV